MGGSARLTVVVPTKNEESNISTCLGAFAPFRGDVELIVVDNSSPDRTREIAESAGATVFVQGPERCAQRNRGWRAAKGEFVMFVDADMIVPAGTTREILEKCSAKDAADAFYVPEMRVGKGVRLKARNFERGFYAATCIDGLRVIRRSALEAVGGYDESLVACEDWDLDRRLLSSGVRVATTAGGLLHNEARQDMKALLKKKAYYSKSIAAYRGKWGDDETCRRQFGLWYRYFGVFVEGGKWRRLVRHPILAAIMYFERIAVGFTYLANR